jgi:hypothetical protein
MSCEDGFFDSLVSATKVVTDLLEQDKRLSTIAINEEDETHLIHAHRRGIEIVMGTIQTSHLRSVLLQSSIEAISQVAFLTTECYF